MATAAAQLAQHDYRIKAAEKAIEDHEARLRPLEVSRAQLVGALTTVTLLGGFAGGLGAVFAKALGA